MSQSSHPKLRPKYLDADLAATKMAPRAGNKQVKASATGCRFSPISYEKKMVRKPTRVHEAKPRMRGRDLISKKKKMKGPKEPNPLSVKKSKKEPVKQKATNRIVDRDISTATATATLDGDQVSRTPLGQNIDGTSILDEASEGQRKRKRRRKPKEASADVEAAAVEEVGEGE